MAGIIVIDWLLDSYERTANELSYWTKSNGILNRIVRGSFHVISVLMIAALGVAYVYRMLIDWKTAAIFLAMFFLLAIIIQIYYPAQSNKNYSIHLSRK